MIHALPSPSGWVDYSISSAEQATRAVLAIVSAGRGSTPRDHGTSILILEDDAHGTIGGGEFERVVIEAARAMLAGNGIWRRSVLTCALGPDLGQCCGGVMSVVLQPIDVSSIKWLRKIKSVLDASSPVQIFFDKKYPDRPPRVSAPTVQPIHPTDTDSGFLLLVEQNWPKVALFGAGHVGRALSTIVSQLPIRLSVFDQRTEQCALVPRADNLWIEQSVDLLAKAAQLNDFRAALIMTHSHQLDYELCKVLLPNAAIRHIGLIGSNSKSKRFRKNLKKDGLRESDIARLTCPIGQNGPPGKEPGTIALAVLSELLQHLTIHSNQLNEQSIDAAA